MSRQRLHWFWRGAIAALVGGAVIFCLYVPLAFVDIGLRGQIPGWLLWVLWISVQLCGPAVGIAFYAWATRRWGPPFVIDNETRRRKCGYILRGITEPRCPECGERI